MVPGGGRVGRTWDVRTDEESDHADGGKGRGGQKATYGSGVSDDVAEAQADAVSEGEEQTTDGADAGEAT
jgi:hypothetical protein